MIYGNHTIQVLTQREGHEDEDGNWIRGEEEWGDPVQCDAQPATGNANTYTSPDGETHRYSYQIVGDKDFPKLETGDEILLTCDGKSPQRLAVKGQHEYAFQVKTWV